MNRRLHVGVFSVLSAVLLSAQTNGIKCVGCERDEEGHIKRRDMARKQFLRSHPCPVTGKTSGECPGYAVDHVTPLYQGGVDKPENMQWLSVDEHKAKHKHLSEPAPKKVFVPPASYTAAKTAAETPHKPLSYDSSHSNSKTEEHTIYTGPRGGRYHYSESGKKVYEHKSKR